MTAAPSEVYSSMGLRRSEYDLIVQLMGREPTQTELGMFAVMWSEHCGYKYSRPILAAFKQYKEALEGKGLENAGIVDIGDGLGITMKVESHNHPSAVEPYQGAATGVGGIIRDILTMGARPIASLNSLRFGPIGHMGPIGPIEAAAIERNRYLFEHVVAGIAGYGNCVGVPTVGGEVNFHPRYSGNPLVNAMCVGLLKLDEITTAAASGVGNPVIYLGSSTGRDGIHGATFASESLDEENEAKRPNVQIGDPFAEKLLIEAILEALQTGAIVAIQDMGAAGLTCSTIEMASKGKVGMSIDLDLVPVRDTTMGAYELMLSESQERMLAVAEKGREQEVLDIFHKWGLHAVVIGQVTNDSRVTVRRFGKVEASVDPIHLADRCPTYSVDAEEPEYFRQAGRLTLSDVPQRDLHQSLLDLLAHPDIASKRWVYRQYDQSVQTQTALHPGEGDAAVLAPRGTHKGIAIKIDGNGRHAYLHPRRGGQLAVCEAARNVACTGATPRAVTDGLNFGNPELPHVYWQFREAVYGIAEAAEALHTPVISGNVSFYNESELGEVLPTPLIGMVGVLENVEERLRLAPNGLGQIAMLSYPIDDPLQGLGGSLYLGKEDGYPAAPNLRKEYALCGLLAKAARRKWIASAHDCSDGGLAVALAEIALTGNLAIDVVLKTDFRKDAALFGEHPGRILVALPDSGSGDAVGTELAREAAAAGLEFTVLGSYAPGDRLRIHIEGETLDWENCKLREGYEVSIPQLMTYHVSGTIGHQVGEL